jgi:hypothetical protein
MNIIDRIFGKPQIVAIHQTNIENKGNKTIKDDLKKEIEARISEQLKDFANGIESWESRYLDDSIRYRPLIKLYNNIELDDTIQTLTDTIYFRITETPFKMLDKNGNENEKAKEQIDNEQFYKLIKYILKCEYYGFGVIQVTDSDVLDIDRLYLRPTAHGVSFDMYSDKIDEKIDERKDAFWQDSLTNFGLFSRISKLYILKREAMQQWAVFNELFTTPYFTVQTDMNDKEHRNNIISWLTNRKHSGYAVFGKDDVVNALSNGGAGWNSYEAFITYLTDSMTKVLLGCTMVTSDGSSRSQSEVHERQLEVFIKAKMRFIAAVINEKYIPIIGLEGVKFEWDLSENLKLIELADVISKMANYTFDTDKLSERFGIEIEKNENNTGDKIKPIGKDTK